MAFYLKFEFENGFFWTYILVSFVYKYFPTNSIALRRTHLTRWWWHVAVSCATSAGRRGRTRRPCLTTWPSCWRTVTSCWLGRPCAAPLPSTWRTRPSWRTRSSLWHSGVWPLSQVYVLLLGWSDFWNWNWELINKFLGNKIGSPRQGFLKFWWGLIANWVYFILGHWRFCI